MKMFFQSFHALKKIKKKLNAFIKIECIGAYYDVRAMRVLSYAYTHLSYIYLLSYTYLVIQYLYNYTCLVILILVLLSYTLIYLCN